jgi:methanogenic corrinoid protein MtbC1
MDRFFQSLVSGDRAACKHIVEAAMDCGAGMESIYLDHFTPALYEVGVAWEENRISVATEHIATAITEYLMCVVEQRLLDPSIGGSPIVISCVANEYHQVGARMIADLLEQHGYDTHFVGANTPVDATIRIIETLQPCCVGLSVSVFFNVPSLFEAISAIRDAFPTLPILVGGQALRTMSDTDFSRFSDVYVVRTAKELYDVVERIRC